MELMNVHYYYREKLFETTAREAAAHVGDLGVALFRAFSLVYVDRVSEALNCLKSFINQPKVSVAAILTSIYAHNHCQVVDREAVEALETILKVEKNRPEKSDLYYESLYHYLSKNYSKAQNCLDDLLKKESSSSRGYCLSGWIQLAAKKPKDALRLFVTAIQQDKTNADALMGEITALGPVAALEKVSSLVVKFPNRPVPLLEKMKLQFANRQFDPAEDTASRILNIQSDNTIALQFKALKSLIFGKYDDVVPDLKKLHNELVKQEPKAWWIFIKIVSCFARCCDHNSIILAELDKFAKSAMKTGYHSLPVLLETGHFYYLSGRAVEAISIFKDAAKLDENSEALCHLAKAHLAHAGLNNEIREQIEFLMELDEKWENPELLLMRSRIQPADALELLDKAVSLLQARSSKHRFGLDYLIELDPELLMRISNSYPKNTTGNKRQLRILNLIVETCPGSIEGVLRLAQTQIDLSDYSEAAKTLLNVVDKVDPSNPQAYLLLTSLYLQKGEVSLASSQLELGLSNNLKIKELPYYHVLEGVIFKLKGNDTACINSIRQGIVLNKGKHKLSESEIRDAYFELSGAHMRKNELKQASQILKEASELLKGTQQESSINVAKARLCALEGDVKRALAILSDVPQQDPHFIEAQIQKAEIYLNNLKDGHGYAMCYKKLVENDPTPENLVLLGDAYIAIQEPDLAVQSYEKAIAKSAGDPKLNCKFARVLVKCHWYQKAIKRYKSSGDEGSVELAELLLKLKQPGKAEEALADLPLSRKALVLAKVYEKSGDLHKSLKILKAAQEESGRGNLEWSAKLCQQMAVYSNQLKDYSAAIDYYKRALTYTPGDPALQIALAKLHMEVNDWNACEALCKSLMAKDAQNEPALLMVADLALRRVDLTSAMSHFASLLARRPDYWVALARLVEVARRSAKLDQAEPYLQAAKAVSPNDPGYHYCIGLYHWYKGETQTAVQSFNGARGDPEWGRQAVHNMVEACMGQPTAHKLLAELKPQTPDEETGLLLLTSFVRLATHSRSDVERAVIDFTALSNNDVHRVGATLGLGMGYIEQGHGNQAKAVLKRVVKHPWILEEADYLERCWLLLGELYIQGGSHQQASDLLQRVITHNQSSAKAYELLGMIAEKNQNYQKASQNYQQAWRLSGPNNPTLGYKLAYNLLKSKKYAESVSICQQVLNTHPDFTKIKKDILAKVMPRLRS